MKKYQIEDIKHCEISEEFDTMQEAVSYITTISRIPWNQKPNDAPCKSWRRCGRDWVINVYDDASEQINHHESIEAFAINAHGRMWDKDFIKIYGNSL